MLLLYAVWALITSAHLAMMTPLHERPREFMCTDQACYSISWASRRYARAKKECEDNKQHLMTVKSSEQANVIFQLFSKVEVDIRVWIGLEPKQGCTDLNLPLRGFSWVTGDSYTDYLPWNNNEPQCTKSGDLCVTVNNNNTWEETDCTSKWHGLLCESSHSAFCSPLMSPDSYAISYTHHTLGLGFTLNDYYPAGTSVHITPSNDNLLCEDEGNGHLKWIRETPGAWPCDIMNGGCDYNCKVVNGIPECMCPWGSKLKEDKRSCSLPCDPKLCSQDCDPMLDPHDSPCRCSEGYHLAEDGKTCLDDACATHPEICGYHCTKSHGSITCDCKPGFEKVDFDCESPGECGVKCQKVDNCESAMCEHACENFLGDFKCVCNKGYVLDENNPKKCKRICNTSDCGAECNENGCNCPQGYILEEHERKCVDMDECLESPCEWTCINTFGSFKCTCPEGYSVHSTECVPDGTKGPNEITTETPSSPVSFPQTTFSIESTILLGICIGIIPMLCVLIAFMCHMLRKHYMDQHNFDYRIKNTEKYVVLQQVKTIPHWKL